MTTHHLYCLRVTIGDMPGGKENLWYKMSFSVKALLE